ncbi:hypothetical protein GGQ57_001093 [Parabacteroides faecis]|jgi:hypothetical protein|uniref:Uncharacterized protein n=1 Tax=Parabacteroides faecis TaxID=1217282 RepID=A0ABR6KIJ6_9BACT|nr:hypothetical protein [Parabacteroides faecis]
MWLFMATSEFAITVMLWIIIKYFKEYQAQYKEWKLNIYGR